MQTNLFDFRMKIKWWIGKHFLSVAINRIFLVILFKYIPFSNSNLLKSVKNLEQYLENTEVSTRGVLLKKMFLKISQNLQKNTCVRVSF